MGGKRRPAADAAAGAREVGLRWHASGQVALRILGEVVRRTWPLLPARVHYNFRAYDAIRRAEAA